MSLNDDSKLMISCYIYLSHNEMTNLLLKLRNAENVFGDSKLRGTDQSKIHLICKSIVNQNQNVNLP